ncbi:hypothetical protein [Listeria kieliensis]
MIFSYQTKTGDTEFQVRLLVVNQNIYFYFCDEEHKYRYLTNTIHQVRLKLEEKYGLQEGRWKIKKHSKKKLY